MSYRAMLVLLEWASRQEKAKQREFVEYYGVEDNRLGRLSDESLGADPRYPEYISEDMIREIISDFEEQYGFAS